MVASTPTPVPPKPLVIGLVFSRTGPLSAYGEMLERGFTIGLEYVSKGTGKIAGRVVRIVVEDDASDPAQAVAAARKLVQQDGADILVGTPGSPQALAIAALNDAELKKIFIVTASDPALTGANFSRYTFRVAASADQTAVAGATYATGLTTKYETIASLYQDNAFGQGANAAWKEKAADTAGISWVQVPVPTTVTAFTSYLRKAANARPDVLVLNWTGDTMPDLYQQIQDSDLFSSVVTLGTVRDAASVKATGDALLGTFGVASYWNSFPRTAENAALVRAYKDKYDTFPDLFAPDGFAAVSALAAGLDKTGGDPDPEKLIPALEGMSFAAPKGKEIFRKKDHQALQPVYIVKMIRDNTGTYDFPVPQLVKEYSADETSPPVRRK